MTTELRRMDDERIARLETKVELWMESTTEYRKALCSKLDTINTKLDNMPCSKGHDVSVDRQLSGIWWIVSICLVAVVSVGVAWGSISKQVEVNTDRWNRYLEGKENGNNGVGVREV